MTLSVCIVTVWKLYNYNREHELRYMHTLLCTDAATLVCRMSQCSTAHLRTEIFHHQVHDEAVINTQFGRWMSRLAT